MPTVQACGDRAGKVGHRHRGCRSFYEVDAETSFRLSRRQSVHQRPVLRLALALSRGQRRPIVRCPGVRLECLQVSCPSILPCESTVATSTCSSLLRQAVQSLVLASMGWCDALGAPAPSPEWGHPDSKCGSAGETGKDARSRNLVGRGTQLDSVFGREWALRYDERPATLSGSFRGFLGTDDGHRGQDHYGDGSG